MYKKIKLTEMLVLSIALLVALPVDGFSFREEGLDNLETVIAKLYEAVSFEPGKAPKWDLMKELFLPGGTLLPPSRPGVDPVIMSVDDFISRFDANRTNPDFGNRGFNERSVNNVIEVYGNVAHVFSTYESRYTAEDEKPFSRGINSIQLVYKKDRWWVYTIVWDSERQDNPIPEKYLK